MDAENGDDIDIGGAGVGDGRGLLGGGSAGAKVTT